MSRDPSNASIGVSAARLRLAVFATMALLLTVYADVMLTSFRIALLVTVACIALGYPLAYVMATSRPRARKVLLTLVVLPYLTSVLVRTFA